MESKKYNPKNLKDRAGWEETVKINEDGYYGSAILDAARRMMRALDDGKTCEQAEATMHHVEPSEGLSGAMAGMAVGKIVQCHERGEEFGKWWETRFDYMEDLKK